VFIKFLLLIVLRTFHKVCIVFPEHNSQTTFRVKRTIKNLLCNFVINSIQGSNKFYSTSLWVFCDKGVYVVLYVCAQKIWRMTDHLWKQVQKDRGSADSHWTKIYPIDYK